MERRTGLLRDVPGRRLCILRNFPSLPKKKTEVNHKTYYHMKDILLFLAHEPLLEKFRVAGLYIPNS
ncbi:unnamed protein product [Victoria cruziana]